MELEEYEETRTYLNHLYGDIIKVGSRIKTESVSVNALLQAKSNEAEKKKGYNFKSFLNPSYPIYLSESGSYAVYLAILLTMHLMH